MLWSVASLHAYEPLSLSLSCFLAVIHYVGETIPPPDNAVNDGIYIHMLAYATAASHICHTQH